MSFWIIFVEVNIKANPFMFINCLLGLTKWTCLFAESIGLVIVFEPKLLVCWNDSWTKRVADLGHPSRQWPEGCFSWRSSAICSFCANRWPPRLRIDIGHSIFSPLGNESVKETLLSNEMMWFSRDILSVRKYTLICISTCNISISGRLQKLSVLKVKIWK